MPTTLEDEPEISLGQPPGADLSTERAASAVEAASLAAQSAASAVERLGGWLALLASRLPQTPAASTPQAIAPEAAPVPAPERENGKQSRGVTENLKRTAVTVGQRISDLSDGRYGLEAQTPKDETRQGKKAQKRLERQLRKEARAEQVGAGVRWFPWMIGMSLGLGLGLIGVAYWQRRRLQDVWDQTSQRMQRATEGTRQRLESEYQQAPSAQSNLPTGMPRSTSWGSSAPTNENNQPVNGRMESTLP